MAKAPTQEEIDVAQIATELSIEAKRKEQELEGKRFDVDESGHGPGVVPEESWRRKKQ